MSWLGSGISQITGQISNFTKEVLTEGTEEVDDHVTELKVAQAQIKKLEQQCLSQKAETDRLKILNDELTEKVEASELQLSSISNSYRAQLNLREDELKALKQQQNELLDSHSKAEAASHTTSSPNLHHHQGLAGAVGDEHDFDDVISSQHEINRLRNQVQRLNAQCQHWKQLAASSSGKQGSSDVADGSVVTSDAQSAELHARIKELERKLQQEVDQHQHELVALQDAHSSKLGQLKRAHKQEVQQLKQEIEKQKEQKGEDESVAGLNSKVEQLEREKQSLEEQLEAVKSEAGELSMRINMKEASLPSSTPRASGKRLGSATTADSSDLSVEVQKLQEQVTGYEQEIEQFELIKSDWEMEKDALQEVLLKLRLQLKEKEDQLNVIQSSMGKQQEASESPESSIADLNSQIDVLKKTNSELQKERDQLLQIQDSLKAELNAGKSKVQELESRAETSRTTGNEQLVQLKKQLEEKASEILSLSQQLKEKEEEEKRLSSIVDDCNSSIIDKESENALLLEQLQELEDQIKGQHETAGEVTSLQKELQVQKATLDQQAKQLSHTESQLKELQDQLKQRENALGEMEKEKEALETSLEELDDQHVQAIQEMIRKRDELQKANEKLKHDFEDLQCRLNESSSGAKKIEEEAVRDNEEVKTLQNEVQKAEQQAQQLRKEKEEKTKELDEMKQKLNQGAVALNELHVNKKELEDKVKRLQSELKESTVKVGELSKEKRSLEELHQRMELEFNTTKEELNVLKDSAAQSQLQEELLQLRDNLNESQKLSTDYEQKVNLFEAELETLQEKLVASDAEKSQLNTALQNSTVDQNKMKEKYEEQLRQITTEMEALKAQKASLEQELDAAEKTQTEQAKQYQACIQELRTARELDTNSLEAEHKKLIKSNHEKELRISQLEHDCGQLQAQVSDTKDMLQDTIHGQQSLTEMINEKESEIHTLRSENAALKQTLEETIAKSKGFQTDLDRLVEVEKLYKTSEENASKLKQEIETINSQLQTKENDTKSEEQEKIINELESKVKSLQGKIEEQNSKVETYQKKYESLESESQGHADPAVIKQYEDTIQELQSSLSFLKYDLSAKSSELQQATDKVRRLTAEVTDYRTKLQEATTSKEISDGTSSTSDDGSSSQTTDAQVEELRTVVSQKDDIVNELKSNNDALLRMLEERSVQLHGDKTLVEMHKLESELRGLRMEREQIMNVLNEKSRECSSLKGEVHRLINVISAEKAALSKLQQDNNELIKNKGENRSTEGEEANKEMTKEAVKKLSQIIRDKDLEIESLTQKNETLLQVLQSTSGSTNDAAGAQLGTLMQDKENLMKQVALFQKDREQIIAALNQKHQEVAVYYTELQKLTTVHKEVTEKQDELNQQFTMLQYQYEDKQQQLLKSQIELVSFKQKYTEADNRYNELLQRRSESPREIINGSVAKENGTESADKNRESPFQVIKEDVQEVQLQNVQQLQGKPSRSSPANNNILSSAIIEEKQKEIESLKGHVQNLRENVSHKDGLLEELKRKVENREGQIQQRDNVIGEKDKTISALNARVHRAEEKISQKDAEINTIRKQQENLAFQLQGLHTELLDTSAERDQQAGQIAGLRSEIALLKEAKSKFSMELSQKELELNSMREKVKSLQAFVQEEKGAMEKGTMDQMLAETEAMQKQAHMFQQERDQAYMALQQKQSEALSMQNQIAKLQEKEAKLTREVERLRGHLLQIEDGYTQEAIAAEQREKELRNRLAAAEEKALSSTHAVHAASQEATEQVEALQQQLHSLASQRDAALLELSSAQEQANQYQTSLNNLQMVLEQFQHEREVQQAAEIEKYQRDLEISRIQCLQQQSQINALQSELDETQNALQAAQRLSEQLDKKTEAIAALKEEVHIRENSLKQMEVEMGKLANISEAKVDKVLVKNLFIGYFHTPNAKRKEVLHVIASVLGLTEEEMKEISPSGGWLTGLFRRGGNLTGATPPTTPSKSLDKSFSELFVSFLERESSPRPQVRLPADQMVMEQQHRKQCAQQRARTAFNPFAVPAHAPGQSGQMSAGGSVFNGNFGAGSGGSILTGTAGTSGQNILTDPGGGAGASHLLMSSPGRPSFSPLTLAARESPTAVSASNVTMSTVGGSGRTSGSNSGRTTPATTSTPNILRDVLQN